MSELVKRKPYTKVPDDIIDNPNLSWKARGIYLYLASRPDKYDLTELSLRNHAKDGIVSIRSGVKELKKAGLLKTAHHYTHNGLHSIWYLNNN